MRNGCPTEGCYGDECYAAPGRGHREGCTYPIFPVHAGAASSGLAALQESGQSDE